MKMTLTALTFIALPLLALAFDGQDKEPINFKDSLSVSRMRVKLEHSKGILEGLVNDDFRTIGKEARAMRRLNELERWFRADTPQYKARLRAFWLATDSLIEAADKKNLDAATVAYTQMTIDCVACHRQVRAAEKRTKQD
jgi:hypothetical protein